MPERTSTRDYCRPQTGANTGARKNGAPRLFYETRLPSTLEYRTTCGPEPLFFFTYESHNTRTACMDRRRSVFVVVMFQHICRYTGSLRRRSLTRPAPATLQRV